MGYTRNGVRMAGPEPQNPVLLYNLGCNGVGILPSALGGRIIARHLAGEKVERSIFDVPAR
jgi:glycine/D-amino acid oxidase-like deaminating enzyme